MNKTDITNSETNIISFLYITFKLRYIFISCIKLGLSIIFSFIISIERELHSHPGGACTHILVGLGSCLFTMISIHLRDQIPVENADPARICAQIVSGMGFLGSATIFKSNNYVKGINTAASLWISAAISMSIGADLWELGLITTFFTLLIFLINSRYKRYRYSKKKKNDNIDDNNDIEEGIDNNLSTNIRMNIIKRNKLPRNPEDAPYGDESIYIDD